MFGFSILLFSSFSTYCQHIPHYEIVFPDKVKTGSIYSANILTNNIISDLIIFDESNQSMPFRLNISSVPDINYINSYELKLTAPYSPEQVLRILVTWDTGIKRIIQEFRYKLDIDEQNILDDQKPEAIIVADIDIQEPAIQIYPNPSQGQFIYIENSPIHEQPYLLKIYDIFGQLVDQVKILGKRTVYRTNELKTGNYVFTFFSENNVFSEQVKVSSDY